MNRSSFAAKKLSVNATALYRKGFPGFAVANPDVPLLFQDYSYGSTTPKRMSAIVQQKFVDGASMSQSLVLGCYSSPTDRQAFQCAGKMAHRALEVTRSIQCFSVQDIVNNWRDIPQAMVYVIYGVDDALSAGQNSSLRSFLYARDGSMRILVMTGNAENSNAPWDIARTQLHVHLDGLLVLADSDDPMQASMISEKASRRNLFN